jgi:hypothetical protein
MLSSEESIMESCSHRLAELCGYILLPPRKDTSDVVREVKVLKTRDREVVVMVVKKRIDDQINQGF